MSQIFILLDDTKKVSGLRTYYEHDKVLFKKMNSEGWGVYFAVNEFEQPSQAELEKAGVKTARNIQFLKKLRYLFADLDIAKAGDKLSIDEKNKRKTKLLDALTKKSRPTRIIETANGIQPLWKIDEEKTDADTQALYVGIINSIIDWSKEHGAAGDQVKDVTRILRMPGYNHMKEKPFMCEIISEGEVSYTLEEMAKVFPPKIEKAYTPPKNFKLNDTAQAVDYLDFRDLAVRAFNSVGRQASFDKQGRLVLDGKLTGNFQGKREGGNYMASTSHEDLSGNKVTFVAKVLACTNTDAYKWIVKEFGLTKAKVDLSRLVEPPKKKKDPIDEHDENPLTWGTENLDNNMSPIEKHHFIIFAGEQSSGKTAFTFDQAIKNSKLGHKVLYISLEMNTENIFTRIARNYAGIEKKQWRLKSLISSQQKSAYIKKKKELEGLENLIAIGCGGVEPTTELISEIMLKHKPRLVFVDNFDLVVASSKLSELQQQEHKAKFFMDFTNEHEIPIIVLHHLKKSGEGINQIRGSGKITDNADVAIMIERDYDSNELTLTEKKDRDWGEFSAASVYFNRGSFYDDDKGKPEIIDIQF